MIAEAGPRGLGSPGDAPINVLIVDDNPLDAEMCLMELRRAGIAATSRLATDRPELRAALASFTPDVILCDFSFPGFDGIAAQRIIREVHPSTPLIFVTGTITEDRAVAALQSGAVDYILKSHLKRLPSAVQRVVGDAKAKALLETSLKTSEDHTHRQAARLQSLWRIVNDATLRGDAFVAALLQEAAASMRPGEPYVGILRHIEGNTYVIDAACGDFGPDADRIRPMVRPGTRLTPSETLQLREIMVDRTQSWNDVQMLGDVPHRFRTMGWHGLIATQFVTGGIHYELMVSSLGAPSATPFAPADDAYIEVLAGVFTRETELEALEASLRSREARTRRHAERLEALWLSASDRTLSGMAHVTSMLTAAETTISPGQRLHAVLGRIEGDDVVVVAVGSRHRSDADPSLMAIGKRIPLQHTIIPRVGRTQAWEDLATDAEVPHVPGLLRWRAVISTQFNVDETIYSLTFASLEALTTHFGPEDRAYIDVLASSLAKKIQVGDLEASLRLEEERARQHADRLESLWHIVSSPNNGEAQLRYAMLGKAASAIRPGQNYRGMLWRIEGDEMIVEAVTGTEDGDDEMPVHIGSRIPLEGTIAGVCVKDGTPTRSWDDLLSTPYARMCALGPNVRSCIVTVFDAGGATWGISFGSARATLTPLGPQDRAFVEVLTTFFANRAQQSWQFDRIQYQQSHDVLTGVLNRSHFRSQARAASAIDERIAVIVIDVNAFHEVNESYGPMIGDAVLVEVASALRARIHAGEVIGRIGGDVFAVLIPEAASREYVLDRAADFGAAFEHGFSIGDRSGSKFVGRSASLGIAIGPDDGPTIDEIFGRADTALSVAKTRGHSSIAFYEAGMEADAQQRATLRNELLEAIARDQFVLYYQPHVELKTGAVVGCEALIRWNHPERGLVPPGQFIPFAEQTGLITKIDEWVMRNALAAAAELARSRPGFRLYFNLSGRQASDPKVVRTFVDAARSGVDLGTVGVEITESDAMRDVVSTSRVCRALRRLGVKIAIDDFGTGYSSLSFLQRLAIDVVKIDRSFVSGVLNDPHDGAITDAIISISDRFGLASLGEGAETVEELDWLRDHGCGYVQGYAVCYPLAMDAFRAWLTERVPE